MAKNKSARNLSSSVLDNDSLNASTLDFAFSINLATVEMAENESVPDSPEGKIPDEVALAALKRWIKKHGEPGHIRTIWHHNLFVSDIIGGELEVDDSNASSSDTAREWGASAVQNSNMHVAGFIHHQLEPSLESHWQHIVELGLDADFEDGVPGSFDDELDAFLTHDTATRILFAWSALQSTPDNQFLFYRFVERIGYSSSVASHAVPHGLLSSALQSSVPGVRAAAAHALGTIGDATSVQTLQDRSFVERNAVVAEIIRRHIQGHVSAAPDPE